MGGAGRRDSRERSPRGRKGAGRGRDRYEEGGRYEDRDAGYREGRGGGGSDDEEPLGTSTIWIGGCPQNITERDIERVTSRFGTVHKVTMKTSSRDTFCFVQYGNERNARDAIRQLDQTRPFGEGVIKVATANKKPTAGNRSQEEGYNNNNNNNRDGGRGNDMRGGRRGDSRDARRGRYNDRDDRGSYDDRDRSFDNRDRGGYERSYRREDRKFNDRNDRRGDDREGRGQSYSQGGRKDSRSPPPNRANSRKPADQGNRPVKVYLSQLPRDMEEDELMEVASEYGEVLSHSLERQGAYKFGWVTYAKKSEAETAIQELDDRQMQGWHMRLQAYMYPTG